MSALPKFEFQVGENWQLHQFPKVFVREQTKGPARLKIAASERGSDILLQLAAVLGEPFALLYVLVVPRGGSAEGRYQSPWLGREQMAEMFGKFADYWDQDGRHHVWLFSQSDRATLVYDQHNVIFAYGPLEDYVRLLEASGFAEARALPFPAPHTHCYHPTFDPLERELTSLPNWQHSPLREGDAW